MKKKYDLKEFENLLKEGRLRKIPKWIWEVADYYNFKLYRIEIDDNNRLDPLGKIIRKSRRKILKYLKKSEAETSQIDIDLIDLMTVQTVHFIIRVMCNLNDIEPYKSTVSECCKIVNKEIHVKGDHSHEDVVACNKLIEDLGKIILKKKRTEEADKLMKKRQDEKMTITMNEFIKKIESQGVPIEDATFRCPACGQLQSANDLIAAGAGKDFSEVEGYLAFSCIGRWDETKGCDWTLGGLFQIHELEIVTADGRRHPRFMPVARDCQSE